MDQHKIKHNKKIGGEISSQGVPFPIDVKAGEKEKEHDDNGSMSISINEKGGDCRMRLPLMSKVKKTEANNHQFEGEFK